MLPGKRAKPAVQLSFRKHSDVGWSQRAPQLEHSGSGLCAHTVHQQFCSAQNSKEIDRMRRKGGKKKSLDCSADWWAPTGARSVMGCARNRQFLGSLQLRNAWGDWCSALVLCKCPGWSLYATDPLPQHLSTAEQPPAGWVVSAIPCECCTTPGVLKP